MEIETELAKTALANSHNRFFCINCGRPRRTRYCPVNSTNPKEFKHVILERVQLPDAMQIELYIKGGLK